MLRSMTGFGRAKISSETGEILVEIQSLNRKFLDVNLFLPKDFFCFELDLRKQIQQQISRGSIQLRVFFEKNLSQRVPGSDFLKSFKEKWEALAVELGYEKKSVDFEFLIERASLEAFPSEEGLYLEKPLQTCVGQALLALIESKEQEGKKLFSDLLERIKTIEEIVKEIEKLSPNAVKIYRERLKTRLDEFLGPSVENEEKILREIAVFAEKIDVTEELVRLKVHLNRMQAILHSEVISVGRELDFLIQEMSREINTLSVKSSDATVSSLVVKVKSELEKIREQIQNVE